MKSCLLVSIYVGFSIFGIHTSCLAAGYTFSKIFDNNDPLPNGMGNFSSFSLPSLDGRNVSFAGRDGTPGPFGSFTYRYSAVYTIIDGKLALVADSNDAIPGGIGAYEWLAEPVIDENNVAFAGGNRDTNQNGIYTDLGGTLRKVVDNNTPVPDGTGTFSFVPDEDFGISNGVVAITAGATSPQTLGVYADISGTLSVVANQSTPAPDGSGEFFGASFAGMNGSDVAFGARNSLVDGLFLNSGGTITPIVDPSTSTQVPSGEVDVASGTYVYVEGPYLGQTSLYSNVGGALHVVAEVGDTTPNGVGRFTYFSSLAVEGDEVAFLAVEDYTDGNIFRYADGVLDEVISVGDMLDSKMVVYLSMWEHGLDNGAIVFSVEFVDGSSGIYLALVDTDGDGVSDDEDNCILDANGLITPNVGSDSQLDTDNDGYGNVCDPDFDNSANVDFADLAYLKSKFFTSDADADLNGDGKVDFADLAILKSMFFGPPGPSGLVP